MSKMSFKIKALRDLTIRYDDDRNEWIYFHDFTCFLKANSAPKEQLQRNGNIFRWLKGKDNAVKELHGKPAFSIQTIIQYCLAHAADIDICKKISKDVIDLVVKRTPVADEADNLPSILSIYERIANEMLFPKDVMDEIADSDFDKTTLNIYYKDYFKAKQWWKICLFEHHFQREHRIDIPLEAYDSLVAKKHLYLDKLMQTNNIARSITKYTNYEINYRNMRRDLGNIDNIVSIIGTHKHIPSKIEQDVSQILSGKINVNTLICVDCTSSCQHSSALHVYIEVEDNSSTTELFIEIAKLIESVLQKKHKESCVEILFFDNGTFEQYKDESGTLNRFQIRDDLLMGHLDGKNTYAWNKMDMENNSSMTASSCYECFEQANSTPLSMKTFNVFKEWYLETPLQYQLLMDGFINKRILFKTEDQDTFLKRKLTRLYSIYDSLLNVTSKNYFGIIQILNTEELLMNFHSIKNVFNLTSSNGMTQSLKTAEQYLKKETHDEKTYYSTYLQKHPILLNIHTKQTLKHRSLRECALVLMLDNLVRLKKKSDPDPGEGRTMQLCTLPITLKGLPLDSDEIRLWHSEICRQNETCLCEQTNQLSNGDVDSLILTLSLKEKNMFSAFKKIFVQGYNNIWKRIFSDGIHQINTVDQSMDINTSFATLTVGCNQDDEEETEEVGCTSDSFQKSDNVDDNHLCDDILDDLSTIDFENLAIVPNITVTDEILDDSFIGYMFDDQNEEVETTDKEHLNQMLIDLNFKQFKTPNCLTRHPPPAVGRDDDIKKLKEVLDDILIKSDSLHKDSHKILIGADHKIASNLFKLRESNKKYDTFLPEFPSLHLRKSKITILCSAYKDAGIIHMLKYIRDDEFQEWKRLISADHIESATKYIERLSTALHITFFIKYLQSLETHKQHKLQDILCTGGISENTWKEFDAFLEGGRKKNGTFALHYDLMVHCDEISAIAFAERLGGPDGYSLLLAAVKSSLPFSFLNGASSYAAFTTNLLHVYYQCGHYYRQMKHSLFSTPIPGSEFNFALDTQREMDHKDALKAFRSGSTMSSIIPRMSLLDKLNEVHETAQHSKSNATSQRTQVQILGLTKTDTDINYILKIVNLILRQDGISLEEDNQIYNVYDVRKPILSSSILDTNTIKVGTYLVKRFVANTGLFGSTKSDEPTLASVDGPKELIQKLKQSKGVTLKRTSVKVTQVNKTTREKKEQQRKKSVQQEYKKLDCFSSDMNACQAIVKPDCSKPKVLKSTGIRNALFEVMSHSYNDKVNNTGLTLEQYLEESNIIYLSKRLPPSQINENATIACIEFAGVKFKTMSTSGQQYLKYVENSVLTKTKLLFPKVHHIALCEEKYQFTPDDFKSATRKQRHKSGHFSITHLKTDDEILSTHKFDRKTITASAEGKFLIGTYLAKHLNEVSLPPDVVLDVDSELHTFTCQCEMSNCCHPNKKYTNPVRACFSLNAPTQVQILEHIHQTKGEAEMAQIDWLMEYAPLLKEGESAISFVTSGDIDAVLLHLFALAFMWPRSSNNLRTFQNNVYVILQKPGGLFDIYNITKIITVLEEKFNDPFISQKVALVISLGGNDFLPKFFGISHKKTVQTFLQCEEFKSDLFKIDMKGQPQKPNIQFNENLYLKFIKYLYTPKNVDPNRSTYDDIRQISIFSKRAKSINEYKNPQTWMPPTSAINQLSRNVKCLIDYYLTAGHHESPMPNFMQNGCFKKLIDGTIEYDLGKDSHILDINDIISTDFLHRLENNKKRKQEDTPQKGARRKLKPKATSTPRKPSHQ